MSEREALIEKLVQGDRTPRSGGEPVSASFLRATVDFAATYARLERLVLGGTRVLYSPSALELDLSLAGDVIEQAERLAEAERARFDLPAGPILELGYLVEAQGVKVIPRLFPDGTEARGCFFFDADLGPCIVLEARGSRAEIDYALAHQYGHFLADYDPYIATICGRPSPESLLDPAELRAHQFALAYLMPRTDLEMYREAMGVASGHPVPVELVHQLQVYFDVDYETVFWRLLSLGWIDPARIQVLLEANREMLNELRGSGRDPEPGVLVPERFIRLVAGAFGRKLIELGGAAEFLATDEAEARRILSQFSYESDDQAAPPQAKPRLPPAAPPERSNPNPN
jgi:Zn-dependent peptidase ImmA (M78 family)